jgi:ATP synthase F1 gamma subunit
MKRPNEIAREEASLGTLVELTSAFEGIASMRIAQIKDQVLQSTRFFNELWAIYSQLQVDDVFRFGRGLNADQKVIDKDLYIIITAEGGFSGDIDQKLLEMMLRTYTSDKNEIVVIGHHGAIQLAQRGISYSKYFKLPNRDKNINVMPIIKLVKQYRSTKLFYQEYVSLMTQDVKQIDLSGAITQRGSASRAKEVINEANYIFEPSTYAVAAHLESSMMQIAVSQLILESKLAQYASRFRAMSASKQRATEDKADLHLAFNRARRGVKDERLKEIINGIKKAKIGAAA